MTLEPKHADPYASFASRYDRFREGESDSSREDFFRTLFERHNVRRVLDCACGTGGDLLLFRRLGVDVVGSDRSEAMLEQARLRLGQAGVSIPLHQLDYRDLSGRFDPPFDAVVCLSTSLPHLTQDEQLLKALGSMRSTIRDGGLVVLDQGMTDRQWRERPRFVPALNTRDFSRVMAIDYLCDRFVVHVLDLVHESGRTEFYHDSFTYRRLLRDDYARLLAEAGFGGICFCGDYSLGPYEEASSRRLIVLAVR